MSTAAKLKLLAIIALFLLGWAFQPIAIGALLTVGIGTGACLLAGMIFSPLAGIGRFFVPHGLIAIGVAALLAALPPPPFGGGPVGPPPLAAIPGIQSWALDHWQILAGVGAVLAAVVAAILFEYTRAQSVVDRCTHPKVALALQRQGKFAGYRLVLAGRPGVETVTIGGDAAPSQPSAASRVMAQGNPAAPKPASPVTMAQEAAAVRGPAPAPAPGWWVYTVPAPDLFEPLLAGLLASDIDFRENHADLTIRVPDHQRPKAEQVIQKLVGQSS